MASGEELTTTTSNATGSGRNKVALAPGHSLMDWIKLGLKEDLTGLGGRILKVTPEELEKHNTEEDAWICVKGNVYNVTRYLAFHPGGEEELMRGVGTDATDLFNQIHAWVNYESMLSKCFVGKLVCSQNGTSPKRAPTESAMAPNKNTGLFCLSLPKTLGNFFASGTKKSPTLNCASAVKPDFSYEWSQDDCTVSIVVTVKTDEVLERDSIAVDVCDKKFRLKIKVATWIYFLVEELAHDVYLDCNVCVNAKQKTVTVRLVKCEPSISWESLGFASPEDGDVIQAKDYQPRRYFRNVTLSAREQLTHDSYLFTFDMPKGTLIHVPVGQHVSLRVPLPDGSFLTRSYTPVIPSLETTKYQSTDGKKIYLMLKIYEKGQMTQKLDSMQIGDQILMADSVGTFVVHKYTQLENLVLLGAGTGFTPMVRMIHWALYNCKDLKSVRLMSFHKTFGDILCREQLEYLQQTDRRFIHDIILSDADESWTGKTGRVRSELLRDAIPSEKDNKLLIGICGPPPFTAAAAKLLQDAGYTSQAVHRFES